MVTLVDLENAIGANGRETEMTPNTGTRSLTSSVMVGGENVGQIDRLFFECRSRN
jgi:hypothetical protein